MSNRLAKPVVSRLTDNPKYRDGLRGCWAFNEQGGSRITDLTRYRAHGSYAGSGALPTRQVGQAGRGVRTNISDDNYISIGNPSHLQFATETQSIIVWHEFEGPAASEQILLGYGNIGTQMNYMIEYSRGGSDKYNYWVNSAAVGPSSIATVDDEVPHCFGVTRGGSNGNWVLNYFLDGKRDLTDSAFAQSTNASEATAALSFGRIGAGTFANPFEGTYHLVAIWEGVKSPQIMLQLTANPHLMLWRPKPIVPGFVAAPVAGGSKPPSGLALLGAGS